MHEEYLNEERRTADLCCPQWNSWLIFVYPPTWIFFQIRLHHQTLVHKRIQLSRAQLNPAMFFFVPSSSSSSSYLFFFFLQSNDRIYEEILGV